jgi:iron complex transport system permease protein
LSVAFGETAIASLELLKATFGLAAPEDVFIVWILRFPRVLVAVLVGIALAIAGTIAQAVTRNPLASPSVLGVNAGASLAVVTLIVALPTAAIATLPVAALSGAAVVAFVVYLLAGRGTIAPTRLILAGVGCQFVASAATQWMMAAGNLRSAEQALLWLAGSVYGRGWPHLAILLPGVAILSAIAILKARELDVLSLGEDVAIALGSALEQQRLQLLAIAVALAAVAVSVAGAVGFVGLIAPHLARQWVGANHARLLPVAALFGALLMAIADGMGRSLFHPVELPCGLITAILGAPYFAYLLIVSIPNRD